MWKLLIVEDEPLVQRMLRDRIDWRAFGFEIAGEADNGEEALRLIGELRPDAVVSDIAMPLMDGIELLKRVRASGNECRFLMLTCMNEFEYARQALEYGASAYVLKLSMDEETLREPLARIRQELASRGEVRQLRERSRLFAYEQRLPALWDRLHALPSEQADRQAAEPLPGDGYVAISVILDGDGDDRAGRIKRHSSRGGDRNGHLATLIFPFRHHLGVRFHRSPVARRAAAAACGRRNGGVRPIRARRAAGGGLVPLAGSRRTAVVRQPQRRPLCGYVGSSAGAAGAGAFLDARAGVHAPVRAVPQGSVPTDARSDVARDAPASLSAGIGQAGDAAHRPAAREHGRPFAARRGRVGGRSRFCRAEAVDDGSRSRLFAAARGGGGAADGS